MIATANNSRYSFLTRSCQGLASAVLTTSFGPFYSIPFKARYLSRFLTLWRRDRRIIWFFFLGVSLLSYLWCSTRYRFSKRYLGSSRWRPVSIGLRFSSCVPARYWGSIPDPSPPPSRCEAHQTLWSVARLQESGKATLETHWTRDRCLGWGVAIRPLVSTDDHCLLGTAKGS
jgi:hypothetical protein